MSYCRTTLFEYQTEEDANELFAKYQANAPTNFPDAEVLLCTRKGPKTAVMTSLYASKEKADQAMADENLFWKMSKPKSKVSIPMKARLISFAKKKI